LLFKKEYVRHQFNACGIFSEISARADRRIFALRLNSSKKKHSDAEHYRRASECFSKITRVRVVSFALMLCIAREKKNFFLQNSKQKKFFFSRDFW